MFFIVLIVAKMSKPITNTDDALSAKSCFFSGIIFDSEKWSIAPKNAPRELLIISM